VRKWLLLSLLLLLLEGNPGVPEKSQVFWGNGPALAQGANLEPLVQLDFPVSITFQLRARAPAEITSVVLSIWVDRIGPFEEVLERHPSFTSAKDVEASWTWDMRKVGGLPPGTGLSYSWTVQDASEMKQQTERTSFQFDDTRFRWSLLEADNVKLFWYQGDEAFARQLLQAAQEALAKLRQDTGAELGREVKIYIYNGTKALQDARIFPQVWEGGVAFPEYGIIAIGITPANLSWGKGAVAHELAHQVTYQVTYSPYSDLPTWLDEGLAMYAQGELPPEQALSLTQAAEEGRLFSVRSLASAFPADPSQARLAYAQSESLVEFLLESRGRDGITAFLQAFRDGVGYEEALKGVYGLGVEGLDTAWREYLGAATSAPAQAPAPAPTPKPRSFPSLVSCRAGATQGIDLGSLLGLLLGTALVLRRRRNT